MLEMFKAEAFDEEVLKSDIPVLVDFYAEWCGPCKLITPIVEDIAKTYSGRIKVGIFDIDENEEVAVKCRVMTIPAVMLFKRGEAVASLSGVVTQKDVSNMIRRYVR